MPNHLEKEPSPYLQQHANNPVDWYPWGDDAFDRARLQDKPIFLSIGYSTCHWCHVMEHESFEDPDIAAYLNDHFVSVKVDREERPDIDRVYMAFVQATTGSGGWPMSVWITPELKPFFGGTYFPPDSRWGRPGFADVLREVASRWASNRGELQHSADAVLAQLRRAHASTETASGTVAGVDALVAGVEQYAQVFDARYGGFGGAPKFPRPAELLFLLRESARSRSATARSMAVETLEAMANGGMRDQIGGGFHRYSVDAAWRVPHFEKMLYDQAQLAIVFLEAGQATGGGALIQVAEDTIAYVMREMTHPDGGFYSAEDADSLPPGGGAGARKAEGAFYLWTASEIDSLLGRDSDIVKRRFGIESAGNAPQDPMGEFNGRNIPYLQQDVGEIARLTNRRTDQVAGALSVCRRRLFDARAERQRPHLDDKVLTAWNGLMIAALARAGHVLDGAAATRSRDAASGAASFLRRYLWDGDRRVLCRRFRNGQVSIDAYAEDYAYLIWGLLELFQVTGDVTWFDWATELQTRQDALFWDETAGGWFATTDADPSVLFRVKEDYDGAEPSASSVTVGNLLTLAHLTGDTSMTAKIERTLGRLANRLTQAARVVPMMMASLVGYHAEPIQVVILGDSEADDTRALERVVAAHYLPFSVRLMVAIGEAQQRVAKRLPFVGSMRCIDGRATAYVCRNFACQEPVVKPERLDQQLGAI